MRKLVHLLAEPFFISVRQSVFKPAERAMVQIKDERCVPVYFMELGNRPMPGCYRTLRTLTTR